MKNNWIPKNKTVKLAIVVASLSLLLYLVSVFLVSQKIKQVENLYGDTESKFFKEKKIQAIKSIAEKNSSAIITLRNFFIGKNNEANFIEQIEKTAQDSGLDFKIQSINVKEDNESNLKEDLISRINIEGNWEQMIIFIDSLEKLPFGVIISNLDLDVNSKNHWSGFVEFIVFKEK